MKRSVTLLFALFLAFTIHAQDNSVGKKLPSIDIKKLNGEVFNTSEINNDGKPIVISFWALWCKPCMKELNAIADVYDDWKEETGVKVIAISIDDARSMQKVKPTVDGNNWEYEVYLDPNGDFKRAMGVNLIPHLFILNSKKEIVYQHTSYADGGENELFEIIKKVAKGEYPENSK